MTREKPEHREEMFRVAIGRGRAATAVALLKVMALC